MAEQMFIVPKMLVSQLPYAFILYITIENANDHGNGSR